MTLDNLFRRLERAERRAGIGKGGLGRYPAIRVITESDEDRDRQLAALQAAGCYRPGQLVIDRRIVDPYPERLHS